MLVSSVPLGLVLLVLIGSALAREGDKCYHRRQRKPGMCKPLSKCTSVSEELAHKTGTAQLCSSRPTPTVCCPEDIQLLSVEEEPEIPPADTSKQLPCHRLLSRPEQTGAVSGPPGTKSKAMCERYARFVCSKKKSSSSFISNADLFTDHCESHNKTDQLIVGGREARPKEYPHMALLGYGKEGSLSYLCGGSLISPNFVLTAAHCIDSGNQPVRYVLLGTRNRSELAHPGARPQLVPVAERIKHPDYHPPKKYNDIALLRLQRDASFEEGFVRPACLHTESVVERFYSSASTAGWGLTEWDGDQSSMLMTVTVNLTSLNDCRKSYQPNSGIPKGIISSHVCAGSRGKDSCEGDSGGPLQLFPSEPYCMFHVMGIVSFGQFCGFQYPGVYTRVASFIPWIESIVWP